jgi:hypothetical protein
MAIVFPLREPIRLGGWLAPKADLVAALCFAAFLTKVVSSAGVTSLMDIK